MHSSTSENTTNENNQMSEESSSDELEVGPFDEYYNALDIDCKVERQVK